MSDFGRWWGQQPLVTKHFVAATLAATLLVNLRVVPATYVLLRWDEAVAGLQLWRLATCFLVHGLGFSFLVHMFFVVRYGSSLETDLFRGRLSDLVWMYAVLAAALLLIGLWMGWAVLGVPLMMALIYVWSRLHPPTTMTFMFGLQFSSYYFPWVLCAFSLLQGAVPVYELAGILVGHMYFFGAEIVPKVYGVAPLATPAFLYRWIPKEYNVGVRSVAQELRTQRAEGPSVRGGAFSGRAYSMQSG